jgi:hypothetical protein
MLYSIKNKINLIKLITLLITLLITFNFYKYIIKKYFTPTKYLYLYNTHNKIQNILNQLTNF